MEGGREREKKGMEGRGRDEMKDKEIRIDGWEGRMEGREVTEDTG